jgi:hypothetical protein
MFIFPLFLTKKERRKMDEDTRKRLERMKASWRKFLDSGDGHFSPFY